MPSAIRCRRLLPGVLALSLSVVWLQAESPTAVPGVTNFHQVDEHIYRGAQPNGPGFTNLAKLGIKTVLDLRGEASEDAEVSSAGMRYVHMPWSGFKAPTDSQMREVLTLLNNSSDWPVFVHCKRGADRTGTAIACYRITHDHWSTQQALTEAKSLGMSSFERAMQRYILRFGEQPQASTAVLAPPAILAPPAAPIP